MTNAAWKDVERLVATLLGGVRTWQTDMDVIVPLEIEGDEGPWSLSDPAFRDEVVAKARKGKVSGYVVEVKNWRTMGLGQIASILKKNHAKAKPLGLKNALVIKQKAGRGVVTPYLLVIPLTQPWEENS